MSLPRPPARLLVAPLAAGLLGACVVAPYPHRAVYSQPVPAYSQGYPQQGYPQQGYGDPGVIVDVAPPSPYVEAIPALPFAGAIWIGGHWGWNGGRHHWNRGRYEHPRAGYGWRPHAWVQQGNRWHSHGGDWIRR